MMIMMMIIIMLIIPKEVTVVGRNTDVSDVHPAKAIPPFQIIMIMIMMIVMMIMIMMIVMMMIPIEVTPVGMVTVVRPVFEKTQVPYCNHDDDDIMF